MIQWIGQTLFLSLKPVAESLQKRGICEFDRLHESRKFVWLSTAAEFSHLLKQARLLEIRATSDLGLKGLSFSFLKLPNCDNFAF
jgi:hypothetical protein